MKKNIILVAILIASCIQTIWGAANEEQNLYLVNNKDESGNHYIQMKAYKNHDRTNCAASALITANLLCKTLQKNPQISHKELYDILNNKKGINKIIKPLNEYLEKIINDDTNQENDFHANVWLIKQMIGFKISAAEDQLNDANNEKDKANAQKNVDSWKAFPYTKANIPTGFFMKKTMKEYFAINMKNIIIYHDGLDEDINQEVSFYYDNSDHETKMSLVKHGLKMRNIFSAIKNEKNSFKVIIAPQEMVYPFSHYIVILIRNIGDKKVETITIDPGVLTYNQLFNDQSTFTGWLYQNAVLEPSQDKKEALGLDDGTCTVCFSKYTTDPNDTDADDTSFIVSVPCCNSFQCKTCLQEGSKENSNEQRLCMVHSTNDITCLKALDKEYPKTLNPRLKTYQNHIDQNDSLNTDLLSLDCELAKYKGGDATYAKKFTDGISASIDELFQSEFKNIKWNEFIDILTYYKEEALVSQDQNKKDIDNYLTAYEEIITFCNKKGNEKEICELYFYNMAQKGARASDLLKWIKKNDNSSLSEIKNLHQAIENFNTNTLYNTYRKKIDAIKAFFRQ